MIFYGTSGSLIHTEQTPSVKCNSCEKQSQHTVSVFGKYAYLYWIPIFPVGKKGVSECNHCKVTLEKKDMSEQLKLAYGNIKTNVKSPLKHWSGLAVILALISYGVYASNQHDKDVVSYIENPAIGDVIEYRAEETGYYSTIKIVNVSNDSIFAIPNNYETDKKSGISDIDKEVNYTSEPYGIGKDQIQSLFDDDIFYDINRD
jgi:hypothetical protein